MKKQEKEAIKELHEVLKTTRVKERLVVLNKYLTKSEIFTTQYMKYFQVLVNKKQLIIAYDISDLNKKVDQLYRQINKLPEVDYKQIDLLNEIKSMNHE